MSTPEGRRVAVTLLNLLTAAPAPNPPVGDGCPPLMESRPEVAPDHAIKPSAEPRPRLPVTIRT